MTPHTITPVDPQKLHDHWDLVERGLKDVKRKCNPRNVDWREEDLYAAIRGGGATLYMVARETRTVGFFVAYPQTRPFSGRKEMFLWVAWSIPLCERQEGDDVPQATMAVRDYLVDLAVKQGCDSISALSTRRGFQRWGFKPAVVNWRLWLNATD